MHGPSFRAGMDGGVELDLALRAVKQAAGAVAVDIKANEAPGPILAEGPALLDLDGVVKGDCPRPGDVVAAVQPDPLLILEVGAEDEFLVEVTRLAIGSPAAGAGAEEDFVARAPERLRGG